MRLDVRLVLPLALLVPCVSLACVERQEAPQQAAPQPQAQPQAQPTQPTGGKKSKFDGIPIKTGVGMPGVGGGQTPTATPPPPSGSSSAPAPSASASK